MEFLDFVKQYYIYLILFFSYCVVFSFLIPFHKYSLSKLIKFSCVAFVFFLIFYFGMRDFLVGVDIVRYEKAFEAYKISEKFEIRKDVFYDLLTFILSKLIDFRTFLIVCSSIYFLGFYYGLKKIFHYDVYIALLILFIMPYFVANGVSAIRSGMAASIFTLGLGMAYQGKKRIKIIILLLISVLMHISMLVPIIFFATTYYYKNTKIIFILWLSSIVLSILKINFIKEIVDNLGFLSDRASFYALNEGSRNYWTNFMIFGVPPVLFSIYNILSNKVKSNKYIHMSNAYMLTHIPYILLLDSEYGLRLGYLAEFMMPILLLFPILISPKLKISHLNFKLCILLLLLFFVKAYKIFSA